MNYRYPCTRNIGMIGFGSFLEKECTEPRRNINLYANELCDKFDISNIVLVNSGSSANLVACLVASEKLKNEKKPLKALVSAFTFPTTISALLISGFEVCFADVEPTQGFNIDYNKVKEKVLNDDIGLIVATHFLGFSCDIKNIYTLAQEHGILVIQDACEALKLKDGEDNLYDYADMSTWSFYHPHHLSSYGGGAVICKNFEDYVLADSISHWGRACKCHFNPCICSAPLGSAHQFTYERLGVNVEISELNACFGRWQLEKHDTHEIIRIENYNILYNALKNSNNLRVYEAESSGASMFVFPILLKNEQSINDAYEILSKQGVEIRTLMGGASHTQKAFCELDKKADLPNALHMGRHAFFVGIHQTLPRQDVKAMAEIIKKSFKS